MFIFFSTLFMSFDSWSSLIIGNERISTPRPVCQHWELDPPGDRYLTGSDKEWDALDLANGQRSFRDGLIMLREVLVNDSRVRLILEGTKYTVGGPNWSVASISTRQGLVDQIVLCRRPKTQAQQNLVSDLLDVAADKAWNGVRSALM
jgi:hypothetical protein